ncbi:hypothetical protein D1631_16090 [Chryseobacterium nematophagum]|uniref:Uncharacterized protein n=1 Tax=Chryseobacterium nematophagum TaxID=2305228 RepID=A0A3M7TLR5_9FLAO|nr:hypothetical protein [Chryseobacterium nematophagum]RNA63897.1 hypothetical protein D1631_16090 [Chryseobacterium nematophagum]
MKSSLKHIAILTFFLISFSSCDTQKIANTNLPQDISERPIDESSKKYDEAQLDKLKASIEGEISKEKCTNATQWTFAPMGAKSCGGPQLYIAYPKDKEATILPKINDYTEKIKTFNDKYDIVSDCIMVMPPTSIKCKNGKAELITS